ncbi:hypothetical protein OC846_005112 [Tilletia horrida]|uniref:Smr domain-containing protein n=1 Tax=Tilletia horrida TaxID=155126 RepID=A0AAN6GLH0_9BASI|nr:hypothetical protein OC846_005112 [Tilletia horrida]KAK0562394.1 hypothetical protein OC861_005333 [Tilletia horrida]
MSSRAPADLLCAQLEAVFCPSLDPALVAAIAHEPNQTFEQASQILSQLIPEQDQEHEPTESAPSTTSTSASHLEDYAPSTPTTAISDTQLSTFLDQWESNTAAHIPADDDPTLHLTDEEDHGYQPASEQDQAQKETVTISHQDPTISFLAHAFPRLPISLLSSTLQSNAGDLTRTLDELMTTQLLAENPDLASIPAPSSEISPSLGSPHSHDFASPSKKGLDLDQLAQGSSSLTGKKKRTARRKAVEEKRTLKTGLPSAHALNQMSRTRSAAGSPLLRLGDVRQGGNIAGERPRDVSGGSSSTEHRWKDPKDRINVAIPAHLLSESGIGSSSVSATTSLPNTPFLSTSTDEDEQHQKLSPPYEDQNEEERRRVAISEALSQVKITSNPNHKRSPPPGASLADDTSSWVVTSSVLNRLVTLLCPIPISSSPNADWKHQDIEQHGRNPALVSEKEAQAVHARSAFVLSRTTSRLIHRSAEAFDSFHQDSLSQEGSDLELEELAVTIAALAGIEPRRALIALKATGGRNEDGGDPSAALDLLELWSAVGAEEAEEPSGRAIKKNISTSRASGDWTAVLKPIPTKQTRLSQDAHHVTEDGDDEGGYLDGLQHNARQQRKRINQPVASKQSGRGLRSAFSGTISQMDDPAGEDDENDDTKPYASAFYRIPSAMKKGSSPLSSSQPIDVYSLPTLAEAAQVASTRKAAAALSQQRRVAQTAASVVKRDPITTASALGPAAAAQQARDAMTREKLANARKAAMGSTAGAAVVLPASAGVVQLDEDEYEWGGGTDGERVAGRGMLGDLLARRQRALERLDHASQMETEYRAKRVDALRKAGVAFRGGGGGGSGRAGVVGAAAGVISKDRAEIPGSATYFGQPEPPRNLALLPAEPGSSAGALPSPAIPSTSSYGASLAPSSQRALRGSAAWYYADEARRLDAKARSWGLKAAQALVEERKLALALNRATTAAMSNGGSGISVLPSSTSYAVTNRERNVIDLHLLTTGEALAVVREEVAKWWACTPRGGSSSTSAPGAVPTIPSSSGGSRFSTAATSYVGFGPGPLYIITGIGKHSRGNVAVLRPAVCGWLRRGGWDYEEDAPRGRIIVKGYKGLA